MNFYAARQREDGRWEYTCYAQEEGLVFPIGYCRPWAEWEEEDRQGILSDQDYQNLLATAQKHHDTGHASPEEAYHCYQEYLLDHCVSFVELLSRQVQECTLCRTFTRYWATVLGLPRYPMCGAHCEVEFVGRVMKITDSYGPF